MAREEAEEKKGRGTSGNIVVPMLLLAVLGGGAGFGYGLISSGGEEHQSRNSSALEDGLNPSSEERATGGVSAQGRSGDWRKEELVPLQPLIVRMGGGAGKWLRLEGAIAFSAPSKEDRGQVVSQVGEDLMLFLGSTRLEQIASPTGLEFLRDDMNEIVRSRTDGHASRLILKSLVVE